MLVIISLAAFQIVSMKRVKTCKISAVALDSVPVRSAVAGSCGSFFGVKTVSVKTRYHFRKKKLEAGSWSETQIQVSVSSELSKKANLWLIFAPFWGLFFYSNKEKEGLGFVLSFFPWKMRNGKICGPRCLLHLSFVWHFRDNWRGQLPFPISAAQIFLSS